ncbi:MAG: aminotransferase class V-fold PLP-dependent enzyme, partial [Bacteroidetes bacterium]
MSTLAAYRADTPGCKQVIHLNNAGAALPPRQVMEAMQAYLAEETLRGGYETAAKHHDLLQDFYRATARLLHTKATQIAWASSATDAYARALSAIPFQQGDLIVTTAHDYLSNLIAFRQLVRHRKVQLEIVADSPEGGVDMEALRRTIMHLRPRLVAVTHMPTNSGLIQDVYTIGSWCQTYEDCWYLVDACQTAGQLPLEVNRMQCDFLSATYRKFLRGPRGAGFLYVSQRVLDAGLEPRFMDLHSARWTADNDYRARASAQRFELWERNYALVRGATVATDYALAVGLAHIAAYTAELAAYMRELLQARPNIEVLDQGATLGAIVGCYIAGQNPDRLLSHLRKAGLHASITSQAYAPLPLRQQGRPWILRLSPHYYN